MRRPGMVFDHRAEVEDMGMVFQAVVYAITGEQRRRSSSAGALPDHGGAPVGDQVAPIPGYAVGVRGRL